LSAAHAPPPPRSLDVNIVNRAEGGEKGATPSLSPLKPLRSSSFSAPTMQTDLDSKPTRPYNQGRMNRKRTYNQPRKGQQKMKTPPGEELLTLEELAQRLRLHPDTARGLYRRGVIPGLKLGHRTLRFEYTQVLEALRQAGDPAAAEINTNH